MARTELDPDDRDPLYAQLAEIIRGQILAGEIPARHAVPSKRDLMQRYQVGARTAGDAMGLLKEEGLIGWVKGKGLYVVPPEERTGAGDTGTG
jgi:DNA-binding GntR family transcriptional regulator